MEVSEVIDLIKEKIKLKRKYYDELPLIHTLTEIDTLEELLTEITKDIYIDKLEGEEIDTEVWKVFNIKTGKDTLSLFYNKKDTEYYVKYENKIVFDTREDSYYRFKNTGKTWRYRDSMIRVELARGLNNISYIIRDKVKLMSKITVFDIKKLLYKMLDWIFLNEVPEEYRDKYWEEKSKIIKKEND